MQVEMEATRYRMLEILKEDDFEYDSMLLEMSDEELLEEGIKQGYWKRIASNNGEAK